MPTTTLTALELAARFDDTTLAGLPVHVDVNGTGCVVHLERPVTTAQEAHLLNVLVHAYPSCRIDPITEPNHRVVQPVTDAWREEWAEGHPEQGCLTPAQRESMRTDIVARAEAYAAGRAAGRAAA